MPISPKHSEAARQNIQKAIATMPSRHAFITCTHCRAQKKVPLSDAQHAKFCSNPCRYAYKRGPHGANAGGGQKLKGARNPNWKGGKGNARHDQHGRDPEVFKWRRLVLHKCKGRCVRCGVSRNKASVCAHHIKPWALYPDARFDVDNGVILCEACHKWVHSKANTNREYLE